MSLILFMLGERLFVVKRERQALLLKFFVQQLVLVTSIMHAMAYQLLSYEEYRVMI